MQCNALIAIAGAYAATGEIDAARSMLARACQLASGKTVTRRHRVGLFLSVAEAQLDVGQRPEAREIVHTALEFSIALQAGRYNPSESTRDGIELAKIAKLLFLVGSAEEGRQMFEMAENAVNSDSSDYDKLRAWLKIHLARATVEEPETAKAAMAALLKLVSEPPNSRHPAGSRYVNTIRDIALKMIEGGVLVEALIVARTLEGLDLGSYGASKIFDGLVGECIDSGRLDVASDIVHSLKIDYMRAANTIALALKLAEIGRSDEAGVLLGDLSVWLTENEPEHFYQWTMFIKSVADVASMQAELGYREESRRTFQAAFESVKRSEMTDNRVGALSYIAWSLSEQLNP